MKNFLAMVFCMCLMVFGGVVISTVKAGGNPPVPNTVIFRIVDGATYDPNSPNSASVLEVVGQTQPLNASPTFYNLGHTFYTFEDLEQGRRMSTGLYRVVGVVHGLFETFSDPPGPGKIIRHWNENRKHPYAVDVVKVR